MDLKALGDGRIELFQESGGHSTLEDARDVFDLLKMGWDLGQTQGIAADLFAEQDDDESELGEADGPPLPKTIMLLPAGKVVKARDGRAFEVDRDEVVRMAQANGADIMVDFDHSVFGFWLGGDGTGRTSPAAAWLDHKTIRKKGPGKNAAIVGDVNFWTPLGVSSVQNREYRYISPAVHFLRDDDGRIVLGEKSRKPIAVEIVNAALVNLPALRMPALASRTEADQRSQQETKTMNQEVIALMLGLDKSATETQITAAFTVMKSELAANATAIEAAKEKEGKLFAQVETLTTEKQKASDEFTKERDELNGKLVDARLENLSARAIITPPQSTALKEQGKELCELGPKGAAIFEKQIAKLEKDGKPVVEASGLDTRDAPTDGSLRIRGLSKADVEKNAASIPDMTVENYLKHNPDLKPLFATQAQA